MLIKIGEPKPPGGMKLRFFRSPLVFYRLKLGFLLGERFIRLKHWGRKSGKLKETVVEVIHLDKQNRKLFSASGFGEKSQWYQNLVANSRAFITLKNTEYEASARILGEDEAAVILLDYAKAHPRSIKGVARLSGYEMDGTEADVIEFSRVVKIIEFAYGA